MQSTYKEICAIFRQWQIWFLLGMQDIRVRYRRSTIGPFWITLSMAITVYSMGYLYGHLFHADMATYFPYLASGVIGWTFISTLVVESSNVFIESENYIRNLESFLSLFQARLIFRNVIILLHNLIAYLPLLFFFHVGVGWYTLAVIPGMLLIIVNAMLWGTVIGIAGVRYRDVTPIVTSLVQVVFFLTPIMWMSSSLPARMRWIVDYNPFNQFLNLIRLPLQNEAIHANTMMMTLSATLIGFALYALFVRRYKSHVVFWL